jgi:hypothetical protein
MRIMRKPPVLQKKSIFNLRSFGFKNHIIIVFAISICIVIVLSYINLSLYYHTEVTVGVNHHESTVSSHLDSVLDSYLDGAPEGHHIMQLPPPASSTNLTDSLSKKGVSSLPALIPQVRISIVQVSDDSSRSKLAHNIDNLECYARLQGYEFISANIDSECQQRTSDIHFQRQCTVQKIMMSAAANNSASSRLNSEKQQDHWFLVLDGDIALINSNHRIEEYIEASNNGYHGDVIHSLRFHNNEVMAYCYLVKNSKFGRDYIRSWAELYPEKKYVNQLGVDDGTRQLHYGGANSDNGALHWHLLHRLADDGVAGWEECRTAGQAANSSETDVTYSAFVTCFHDVVKQTHCKGRDWDRIDILPRGRHVAVDGWPFGWQFSDRSFMQHTIKNPPMRIPAVAHSIYRPKVVKGRWPPPEFTCNHHDNNHDPYSYRVDKFYVNETYFSALVQWADDLQKKKHNNNPRSRDDSSCVQSGRRGAVP